MSKFLLTVCAFGLLLSSAFAKEEQAAGLKTIERDVIGKCGELENSPPCPAERRPVRYRFQPTQHVWQCNDIRVTWTNPEPGVFNYDIGGTIWGGINFTATDAGLFLRGVPCVPLR